MKRIVVVFIIFLLFIGVIMFMFYKFKNKEIEITEIKSMYYRYSTGTMVHSNVSYSIEFKDNKYIAEIKPNNISDEEKIIVEMKEEDIEKIKKVLKDNHVGKWNGFDKSDKYVLDGDSFSITVNFINGNSINASGYMMWPKNYGEVSKALDDIFMSYWDKEIE